MEEEKKQTKEEVQKNFLKEIREERDLLIKEREELQSVIAEAKELKAFETISGKADAGQQKEKPKEETPEEYASKLMSGKVEVD